MPVFEDLLENYWLSPIGWVPKVSNKTNTINMQEVPKVAEEPVPQQAEQIVQQPLDGKQPATETKDIAKKQRKRKAKKLTGFEEFPVSDLRKKLKEEFGVKETSRMPKDLLMHLCKFHTSKDSKKGQKKQKLSE